MAITILTDAHISAIVGFALSGWITPEERMRGAYRIRKKSYAKVFRSVVTA